MTLVFGIGAGLFSLGIIWIVGIALCLLLSRSGSRGGVFGVFAFLVLVTIVMVLYPRKEVGEVDARDLTEDVDTMAIPRILYAAFVVLFFLIGVVAYLMDHVLMHNIAIAAKVKKTYTF